MAGKDQKEQAEPETGAKVEAPAIIRRVVERTLAPKHMIRDAATGLHKGPGQRVTVDADFVDAHPECFVEE